MRPPALFAKATMHDLIEHTKGLVTKEVQDMPSDYLLSVPVDDLRQYLEDK